MKKDELRLIRLIASVSRPSIDQMSEASARWSYLLAKWARRGFWEYGASLPTGWMTAAGIKWAREAIAREVTK